MNVPIFRLKSIPYWLLCSFGCSFSVAYGAVTLDGTVGRGGSLNGPAYAISADLGRQVGANLFHSFGDFSLAKGESATFSGPSSVANVIGRVTGGGLSTIDGVLRSTISGADLYLVNPNGLVFGPNAVLDLSGSFYASTANYVKLADGGRFDATSPAGGTLTAAPPAAFGFLAAPPAPIALRGAGLTVASGKNISLVGGNIEIDNAGWLWAPGGRAMLASGAAAGELEVAGNGGFAAGGGIALRAGSQVNVSADDGSGSIVIRGGRLQLENASLVASTVSRNGGSVDVAVTQDLALSSGAEITTSTTGSGNGGDVLVSAGATVTLSGRGADGSYSAIRANTTGGGNAGRIQLTAPRIVVDEGLVQSLSIGEAGGPARNGNGGAIAIQTGTLDLRNGGQLDSGSRSGSNGNGGSVDISASESVMISGGSSEGYPSLIYASIEGDGAGGHISIRAPEVAVSNGAQIAVSTSGAGEGGFIQVEAARMSIAGGGEVTANTSGSGTGGFVRIAASDSITVTGQSADGEFSAIRANTSGSGKGGSIRLDSGVFTLDSGLVQALTRGQQPTGGRNGDAGNVDIYAQQVALLNGGQLDSGSRDQSNGYGGNIAVRAAQSVLIDGVHPTAGHPSAIFANTLGEGKGGYLFIGAPQVSVSNGARVSVSAGGGGAAGFVKIEAQRLDLVDGGRVVASTTAAGAGGNVEIAASDSVTLTGRDAGDNWSGIYANTSGEGDGGYVHIKTGALRISDGLIQASTLGQLEGGRQNGNAGLISLELARLSLVNGGQIENGSRSGSSGNGGGIEVKASEAILLSGANAAGDASGISGQTRGGGTGSSILLNSPSVTIEHGAELTASTYGTGRGGDIRIDAAQLLVTQGALVSASSFGAGAGGSVSVLASDAVGVSGVSAGGDFAAIRANTSGTGSGGSVNLKTARLTIDDGAIQALSSGLGNAGNITIGANEVAIVNGGQISSSTRHPQGGSGGGIEITARDRILVSGASASDVDFVSGIFGNSSGEGVGGNIHLRAPVISVANGGVIQASTSGAGDGGSVRLEAGRLEISGGAIVSSGTSSSGWGGVVEVVATESITVSGHDSQGSRSAIRANTSGTGNGGDIDLRAPLLTIDGGTVQAVTFGEQEGGARNGDGGSIFANVGRLVALNDGSIDTGSRSSSSGNGGSVDIRVSDAVVLSGVDSGIYANTEGTGDGGYVFVSAPGLTVADGAAIQAFTSGTGAGGFIQLEGERLDLSGAGFISASSSGTGAGGFLDIRMSQRISLSGQNAQGTVSGIRGSALDRGNGGYIFLSAPRISVDNAVIQALTYGDLQGAAKNGNAGDIIIEAGSLSLTNGGQIDSSSRGGSTGDGGSIEIVADDSIAVSGRGSAYPSAIFANTFGAGRGGFIHLDTPVLTVDNGAYVQAGTSGSGGGGFVRIDAGQVEVNGGGIISAATFASGAGGYVQIAATESLAVAGHDGGGNASTISARTDGSGNGGQIRIQAAQLSVDGAEIASSSSSSGIGGSIDVAVGKALTLRNGAKIESRGSGTGDAGNILIKAGIFDASLSALTTEAAFASGGNIALQATSVRLAEQSAISATVGGGYGDGGNVTVSARGIAAVGNSDITARADQGFGGRITINAEAFLRGRDVDLDASSNVIGNEGVVEVNAPKLDISGSLVVLPAAFLDASGLLSDPCLASHASQESSFVVRGRGGIPAQPDGPLPSSLLLDPVAPASDKVSLPWHAPRFAWKRADCKQSMLSWEEKQL